MVTRETRRVVVVGYDRCELLDIACVTSALDVANRLGATPAYEVVLATLRGASIRCDSGLEVTAQARLDHATAAVHRSALPLLTMIAEPEAVGQRTKQMQSDIGDDLCATHRDRRSDSDGSAMCGLHRHFDGPISSNCSR